MTVLRPVGGAHARRRIASTATLALAAGMILLPAHAAFADDAIDGPRTAGDSMFTNVGNGGYDALDYAVSIEWSPDAEQSGSLLAGSIAAASTTMTARAEQPLRSFSLDFEGMEVDSVTVNGAPATFTRIEDKDSITHKLVVTPTAPVTGEFTTTVAYHGTPVTHIDADGSAEGWSRTTDGAILLGQPVGMMAGYPHNNTPGDKASYTFTLDIPTTLAAADGSNPGPAAAVSNGELQSKTPSADGERTTWTWRQSKPMASELALVGIGRYDVIEGSVQLSDGRTIPSWSFMDSQLSAAHKTTVTNRIAQLQEITQNLEKVYGPYPGNSTGVVVDTVPREINYALETQDRSFFPSANSVGGNTLIHELVHQWYGNNVSPSTWTDIWIAEGMATWGPTHYNSAAGFGSGTSTEEYYFDSWNKTAASSAAWKIAPGVQTDSAELYGYQTYTRSGQFWEALKIAIGDEAFFALLPEWQARYAQQSVTGAELKALAEELSGHDLSAFWQDWIMAQTKPAWPEKLTAKLTTPERTAPLERGDAVEYTLQARNTGKVPLATSVVAVDAASLLASATLPDPLPTGVTLDGTTLSWAVPATAPGADSSVTLATRVADTASGGSIDATARVATLGGTCTECSTTLPVTEYEIAAAPIPTIEGDARVGETLTVASQSWPEGTALTHQWAIDGAAVDAATSTTFPVPAEAEGKRITVSTTGALEHYLPTTTTSAPTATVTPAQVDPEPGAPVAPSESALTEALKGAISFPGTVHAGQQISVGLGAEYAGAQLEAWLFSTPRHLDTVTVDAQGNVKLTIPHDAELGAHRLVIAQTDGTVIGWGPLSVTAADSGGGDGEGSGSGPGKKPNDTAAPGTHALAATGGTVPWLAGALGATLLLGGGLVLASRTRQRRV